MKITRENLKNIVREAMVEENAYQEFFKKALEKTGKSIPQMSDEEKKAFFNKIDSAWKGKGEKNEDLVGNQKKLDIDGDGEIDASDLAALRAGKKKNERFGRGAGVGPTFGSSDEPKEDLDEEAVVVSKRTPEGNIVSKLKEENESINELANAETVNALTAIIGAGGVVGGALALDKLMTALEKGKMGSKGKAIAKTLRGLGKTFAGAGMKGESVNEAFKHIIQVDTPNQIVSKKTASQIMALAKKGVRSKEIGLELGFTGNTKLATDTFQKVKNRIYFDLDKRESVNEALSVDPRKVYGGTGAKEGMVLTSQKGLMKILDLSKKNPSNVFLVSDDNYTKFGPYYVKNGKVAKYTVANPNYDLEKNKVRTLKVPSDVILKFKIVEGVSVNEEKVYIDFLNKKKGFKQDRIKFNSYEAAVKWAKKNFEKFDHDMIHYESVK